jgi:hypothetical protein
LGILLTDLNESALVSLGKFNRMCEQQKQQVPQETSSKLKKSDFFYRKKYSNLIKFKDEETVPNTSKEAEYIYSLVKSGATTSNGRI